MISLTRTFEEYRADGGGDLRLTWTPWNDAPVKLRAEGARPRLHYRMDTTQPGGASPYRWSPRLLAALAIDRRSLGVTAWTQQRIGGEDANVYLPLSVAQGALPPQARVYRVVAVPGRELREVYVSMWAVDGEGRVQGALIDGRPVGHGYYPVGAGVPIEVPQPEAEGIYKLELGASLPSGGAYSVDLLFHHAKN
ncbi:MAG: hypothetical protein QNK03_19555 [Myxococcota bacterium]|nr:hypothetical protein [Myxococcota bacterium]